jgi:hypothetical protein
MSNIAFWIAKAPIAQDATLIGATAANGTRGIEGEESWHRHPHKHDANELPRYIEAIRPQEILVLDEADWGRPPMPSARRAGLPRCRRRARRFLARTRPRCGPFRNSLDPWRTAWRDYKPMNEAAIAPPGVMPSQHPMNDERSSVSQYFGISFHTFSTTLG